MFLLHSETRKLEYFTSEKQVPGGYAILSHTWGEDEVTYYDMYTGDDSDDRVPNKGFMQKAGYRKIDYTCRQALKDGLKYAWVDTCCIDKKSSAELSEAINSMYRYYSNAAACYVYLSDVTKATANINHGIDSEGTHESKHHSDTSFKSSRWFSRGWTLQELIAPFKVDFYDKVWELIGNKSNLVNDIVAKTKIDASVLQGLKQPQSLSVAKRMSWASLRSTTREEDEAYCLLGIFGVNMPLLYGEGRKAFERLQEEIIRSSRTIDHSILLWDDPDWSKGWARPETVLAKTLLSPSPHGFRDCNDVVSWSTRQLDVFELSPQGLRMSAYISPMSSGQKYITVALNCRKERQPMTQISLHFKSRRHVRSLTLEAPTDDDVTDTVFDRLIYCYPWGVRSPTVCEALVPSYGSAKEKRTVFLAREVLEGSIDTTKVHMSGTYAKGIKPLHSPSRWHSDTGLYTLSPGRIGSHTAQTTGTFVTDEFVGRNGQLVVDIRIMNDNSYRPMICVSSRLSNVSDYAARQWYPIFDQGMVFENATGPVLTIVPELVSIVEDTVWSFVMDLVDEGRQKAVSMGLHNAKINN